jgi:hypothetical protein
LRSRPDPFDIVPLPAGTCDVLSFQVRTPVGGYASVNHLGDSFRGGRKSAGYHALEYSIREAARAEMLRTGWTTASYYVEVAWKRYVTTLRGFDASNAMKAELDALQPWEPQTRDERAAFEPFVGCYSNDCLVKPLPDIAYYDPTPGAVDRIAIAVFRLFPPLEMMRQLEADGVLVRPKKPKPLARVTQVVASSSRPADADLIDGRAPVLGGHPISAAEAMKYLSRARLRRR